MLDDNELERYSRQLLLDEWSVADQVALKRAHVVIVGLGGLGCIVAPYLAAAGVGHLSLFDDDTIDASNLQRQILFGDHQLGCSKVNAVKNHIVRLNRLTTVDEFCKRFEEHTPITTDCIVDCSDNFSTRFSVNRWAVGAKTPLVSGSAIRFMGQASSFDFRDATSPCYACLFPEHGEEEESCRESGIMGPVLALVAGWQAMDTLDILRNQPDQHVATLKQFDFQTGQFRTSHIERDVSCSTCTRSSQDSLL